MLKEYFFFVFGQKKKDENFLRQKNRVQHLLMVLHPKKFMGLPP